MYAPEMSLFAPVLVTGFNRPELLEAQLQSLLKMGCKVYLSLDVPKKGDLANAESSQKCISIADRFSADLVGVRISDESLGCFRGVTEAITWGFGQEKVLIILEDDVRVNETFLSYSTLTLANFESIKTVGSIAGTNFVPKAHLTLNNDPFRLSAFTSSWGWATWSDRWSDYLQDLDTFPRQNFSFPTNFWSWTSKRYWNRVFEDTAKGKYDAWDYRWLYSNWKRRRLTVVPNSNLVINVGFGEGATHTQDANLPWWLPREIENSFKVLMIPSLSVRDERADRWMEENHYRTKMVQQLRGEFSSKFPRATMAYRRVVGRA
ncbi:MAG: hypothetical protein HY050_03515 [Actinobacteria bacterium]|nr:hypothetical protein [Actinomycetota bacterium]